MKWHLSASANASWESWLLPTAGASRARTLQRRYRGGGWGTSWCSLGHLHLYTVYLNLGLIPTSAILQISLCYCSKAIATWNLTVVVVLHLVIIQSNLEATVTVHGPLFQNSPNTWDKELFFLRCVWSLGHVTWLVCEFCNDFFFFGSKYPFAKTKTCLQKPISLNENFSGSFSQV